MKLLAGMHIAPRTVTHLQSHGHDVLRVAELLMPAAADVDIVAVAICDGSRLLPITG